MRTSAVVLTLFLVGSAGAGRAPAALGQTDAGWVTLFDGKNFNNWTMTGNANWRIADGIAEADMPRGFLVSRQSYGDFELRVEVWGTPASNAGVLFRITDPRDPGIENAYELNINDESKDQDGRTGSIEVGKDADVAIFSAHPFAPDTRVEMTLVDGVVYFDRAKDAAARASAPAGATP